MDMNNDLESIKSQHEKSYRNAVFEIIKNNTEVLVDQDISSLIKKPPLDSMDYLKIKFLDLAKKNSVILDTDCLDNMLEEYRSRLMKVCCDIKKIRVDELESILNKQKLLSSKAVLKLNKKDFEIINKKIVNLIKDNILENIEKIIMKQSNKIYSGDVDSDIKDNILDEIIKAMKNNYCKQIIDSTKEKMSMKDITLINVVKEQGERYLFTIKNSRLFQDLD